jgi:hypothetical protein
LIGQDPHRTSSHRTRIGWRDRQRQYNRRHSTTTAIASSQWMTAHAPSAFGSSTPHHPFHRVGPAMFRATRRFHDDSRLRMGSNPLIKQNLSSLAARLGHDNAGLRPSTSLTVERSCRQELAGQQPPCSAFILDSSGTTLSSLPPLTPLSHHSPEPPAFTHTKNTI